MNIIKNFIYYLSRPHKEEILELTPLNKFSKTIILLFFNSILIFGLVALTNILIENNIISEPQHRISNSDKGIFNLFLTTVLFYPLVEEIQFRSWLNYNRIGVSILIFVLGIFNSSTYIFKEKLFHNSLTTLFCIFVGLILSIVAYFLLKKFDAKFKKKWSRNTRNLFFISSFLFGFMHIQNYVITTDLIIFSPVILSPFILGGLIIGYLRIRFGFIFGYIFHMIQNSIPLLITILLK